MGDIVALVIIALGVLATVLSFFVVWRYRGERVVPVGTLSFVAMGIGSATIAAFYVFIFMSPPMYDITVPVSRGLWAFVLISTILMAFGVLASKDWFPYDEEE